MYIIEILLIWTVLKSCLTKVKPLKSLPLRSWPLVTSEPYGPPPFHPQQHEIYYTMLKFHYFSKGSKLTIGIRTYYKGECGIGREQRSRDHGDQARLADGFSDRQCKVSGSFALNLYYLRRKRLRESE